MNVDKTQDIDKRSNEEALYRILAHVSLQKHLPSFVQYLQIALNFLQSISFSLTTSFPWPQDQMSFTSVVLGYTRLNFKFEKNDLTVAAWTLFAIYFLISFYILRIFQQQTVKDRSINPFFLTRAICDIALGIVHIPAMYTFGRYMSCGIFSCEGQVITAVIPAIMGIGIITYLIFGIVYLVTVYEWTTTSTDMFAHSSYRAPVTSFLCKTLTSVMYGLIEQQQGVIFKFILAITNAVQCALAVFVTWIDLPYIHDSTNAVIICSECISLWAACMALLTVMMYSTPLEPGVYDSGAVWSLLFGISLVIPSSLYLERARQSNIAQKSIYQLESIPDVDIKARILEKKIMMYQRGIGVYDGEGEEAEKRQQELIKETFEEIDNMYANLAKRIQDPVQLNFSWGAYAFVQRSNIIFAIGKLKQVLIESPSLLNSITAEMRLRQMTYLCSYSSDLEIYLEQSKLELQSTANTTKCLKQQFSFWKLLASSMLSGKDVEKLVFVIDKSFTSAQEQLQRLIYLNPTSPFYRRLYAQFLLNLANDEPAASIQLRKAFDLEQEGRHTQSDDIADKNNGIVIMSGERGHVGEVLQVNLRMCQICGYSQSDLIGKKVTLLMPEPYGEVHHIWINRYVDTAQRMRCGIRRTLIMKHAQGFVFFADIMNREYPSFTHEPSVSFLGVVYPHEVETMFSIVRIENNQVIDVSAPWIDLFPTDLKSVKHGEVYFTDWVPSFNSIKTEALNMLKITSKPFAILVDNHVGSERVPLLMRFSFLPHLPQKYFVVYVDIPQQERDDAAVMDARDKESDRQSQIQSQIQTQSDTQSRVDAKRKKLMIDAPGGMSQVSLSGGAGAMMSQSNVNASGDVFGKIMRFEDGKEVPSKTLKPNIIRMTLRKLNCKVDPSIKTIANVIVYCILFITAFSGIAHYVWGVIALQRIKITIALIFTESRIRWSLMTCNYMSLLYDKIMYRKSAGEVVNFDDFDVEQILLNARNVFAVIDTFLNQAHQSMLSLSPQQTLLLVRSELNSTDFLGEQAPMTVLDTLGLYGTNAALLANGGFKELFQITHAFDFFRNNRGSSLLNVVNSSIFTFQSEQSFNNQLADYSSLAFLVSAITIMTWLIMFFYVPAIYKARLKRIQVFQLFEIIPSGNVRELISQCAEKLLQHSGNDMAYDDIEVGDIADDRNTTKRMMEDNNNNERESRTTDSRLEQLLQVLKESASWKMLFLLLAVSTYYISMHTWWSIRKDALMNDVASRLNWAGYRQVLSRELTILFMQEDDSTKVPRLDLDKIVEKEQTLWNVERAVVYGDPHYQIYGDVHNLFRPEAFLRRNSCVDITGMTQKECVSYKNSIMTRGAHEMVLDFISMSAVIRDNYTATLTSIYNNSELFDPDVDLGPFVLQVNALKNDIRNFQYMADFYLSPVISYGPDAIQHDFAKEIDFMYEMRGIFLVLFIFATLGIYLFLYRPMVERLDQSLKRTRALLQMLPFDVVESTAVLKDALYAILNNEEVDISQENESSKKETDDKKSEDEESDTGK
jgi:PAS domain S-box-containing protein